MSVYTLLLYSMPMFCYLLEFTHTSVRSNIIYVYGFVVSLQNDEKISIRIYIGKVHNAASVPCSSQFLYVGTVGVHSSDSRTYLILYYIMPSTRIQHNIPYSLTTPFSGHPVYWFWRP